MDQIYKLCHSDGVKTTLGIDTVYHKLLNFTDGRIYMYRNDTKDQILELDLKLNNTGYELLGYGDQSNVCNKLPPGG